MLTCIAYFCIHATPDIDEAIIVATENKAVRFCEETVKLACEHQRGSLEYLLGQDSNLRVLFESLFCPPFVRKQNVAAEILKKLRKKNIEEANRDDDTEKVIEKSSSKNKLNDIPQ